MFLLQSDNFLNCPLQIFNSILKTPTIQRSVMSFIVTFYKMYTSGLKLLIVVLHLTKTIILRNKILDQLLRQHMKLNF